MTQLESFFLIIKTLIKNNSIIIEILRGVKVYESRKIWSIN